MKLDEARSHAEWLIERLAPACLQIAFAGGIRREKPEVKDIEIVAEPKYEHARNLFGEIGAQHSILDQRIGELIDARVLDFDPELKRNGDRYKRLILWERAKSPVDLFVANSANWGNILAIRTGDADFSRALVTGRLYGGLMPTGMRQKDGMLWRGTQPLECFTEADFFAALGVAEVPDPRERNEYTAQRLAQGVAA